MAKNVTSEEILVVVQHYGGSRGIKERGDELMLCCPWRADEKAGSFSINKDTGLWHDFATGEGGDILSFVGCCIGKSAKTQFKEIVKEFEKITGTKLDDNRPAVVSQRAAPAATVAIGFIEDSSFIKMVNGKKDRFWIYKNAKGETVFGIERRETDGGKIFNTWFFEKKTSALVKANKDNKMRLGSKLPLYHLNRIVDDSKAIIVLAEGEKAAQAINTVYQYQGAIATTWAHGVSAYNKTDLEPLANRKIVFWPDNDEGSKDTFALIADLKLLRRAQVAFADNTGGIKGSDAADLTQGEIREVVDGAVFAEKSVSKVSSPTDDFLREDYDRTRGGEIKPILLNYIRFLIRLERKGIKIFSNEFAGSVEISGLGEIVPHSKKEHHELTPQDEGALMFLMQHNLGCEVKIEMFTRAIMFVAERNAIHSVKTYLEKCAKVWDGKLRAATFFKDYFGVTMSDKKLLEYFSKRFLSVAVERIFNPGTKFDSIIVLEGKQGIGKSLAFEYLFSLEYFANASLLQFQEAKQIIELMRGIWCAEFAELDGMNYGSFNSLKGMLSRTKDTARLAYAKQSIQKDRQCVFVGTTNETNYLVDATGNRRFWCMRIQPSSRISLKKIKKDRDLIWGEVMTWHLTGNAVQDDESFQEQIELNASKRLKLTYFDDLISQIDLSDMISQAALFIKLGLHKNVPQAIKLQFFVESAMKRAGYERETNDGHTFYTKKD